MTTNVIETQWNPVNLAESVAGSKKGYTINNYSVSSGWYNKEIRNDGTGKGSFYDQNGDNYGIHVDSESANHPAIGFTFSSGGCSSGKVGFYTDSNGDLFWCKNGASTQLN